MNISSNSPQLLWAVFGAVVGLGAIPLFKFVFRLVSIEVEDEHTVLVTRFGKLVRQYKEPGLYWVPERFLPWVKIIPVSLQRDFRHYHDIHVNDSRGTTVIIDLWIEFRVGNPERALYQVENWEEALKSLLTHSATSILGTHEFNQILSNRLELGRMLQSDIDAETSRWGLEIQLVLIRKVSLLGEVSRQMFDTVGAKLERLKADVEEEGRLRVAMLEAQTSAQVASLVAEAKGQYPGAVGRAYGKLAQMNPEVLKAYIELYELSLRRPHRTVAFQGFGNSEGEEGLRALDAAMVSPPFGSEYSPSQTPGGLNSRESSGGELPLHASMPGMIPPLSSSTDIRLQ